MRFYSFTDPPNLGSASAKVGTLVCPGDTVTVENSGFLKGRGVEINAKGDFIATQCGMVEKVNKVIFVRPMHQQYTGDTGDVVVGEISQVQASRWSVELGAHKEAILQLAAVSLPDNAQRRRTEEDALQIRDIFVERDIIVAEVQKKSETGEIHLQTRTAKYGRLYNGLLVTVSASLVRRQPQHILSPTPEILIVLGNNGWIWIGAKQKLGGQGIQTLNYSQVEAKNFNVVPDLRRQILRYANCVRTLSYYGLLVTMQAISTLYEQSIAEKINFNKPEDWPKIEAIITKLLG